MDLDVRFPAKGCGFSTFAKVLNIITCEKIPSHLNLKKVRKEIPTKAHVGACNFALRHATRLKLPYLRERKTSYQLLFEVKAYDLREWRYEQFFIASSLLLRREVCYPG